MLAARRAGALAARAQQFAGIVACRGILDVGSISSCQLDTEQRSWPSHQVWPTSAWSAGYAKASKGKKENGNSNAQPQSSHKLVPGTVEASAFDPSAARSAMERCVERLHGELAAIRSGRASSGMLEHVKAEVYGERMPLSSVATVLVRDPQLLVISVFDPSTLLAVEKAIRESPLQLNPRLEGQEVLVPVPQATPENMVAMTKLCRSYAETARRAVRTARKDAMVAVKALASEDERHRVEKEVQKVTDEYIVIVDKVAAQKEKSITIV